MRYAIQVQGNPFTSASSNTALQFCRALLKRDHDILRVFFSADGVLNANQLSTPPQDEFDLVRAWGELHERHDIELVVCISACLRRGVLNASESERHDHTQHNLAPGFTISGLGQLADAILTADRFVNFAP